MPVKLRHFFVGFRNDSLFSTKIIIKLGKIKTTNSTKIKILWSWRTSEDEDESILSLLRERTWCLRNGGS